MKLKEDRLLIIIQIISLIGLTLSSLLLQLTDNKINDYNTETILSQNGVIYVQGLAQETLLKHIDLFIVPDSYNSGGSLITEKEKKDLEGIYGQNYSEYKNRANGGVLNIKVRLENPPKCLYFYCSSAKEILILLQFFCISVSSIVLVHLSIRLSKRIRD